MKNQTKTSFAQKYNLEGHGKHVRISEKTKATVNSLYRKCDDVIEKGKDYSQQEIRAFGGCPKPGEAGSEKYFSSI